MQTKALFTILATVLAVSGCATQKQLLVTDASRADGVVKLSYESNEFQRASYDSQQAQDLATQKCMAWGYKGAESFGSQETKCLSYRGFGSCGDRRVTIAYQCTGAPGGQ